jgi:hypothetical protein
VAVPAFQAFYIDNGTYAGMTVDPLKANYSRGIDNITILSSGAGAYCVSSTVEGVTWYKAGPSGRVTQAGCS